MLSVLIVSVSYAQISCDARLGANLSGMSKGELAMKFGIKAGVNANYALSKLFTLRSGLFFSMKGASDAESPFDYSPNNTFELNYFELPVIASFHIMVAEKFGLELNAGPSIGYLLSKKPSGWADVNTIDIGVNMGIDFVFNKKMIVGVESQYGISELAKDSKQHNINYSLMLGYRF